MESDDNIIHPIEIDEKTKEFIKRQQEFIEEFQKYIAETFYIPLYILMAEGNYGRHT